MCTQTCTHLCAHMHTRTHTRTHTHTHTHNSFTLWAVRLSSSSDYQHIQQLLYFRTNLRGIFLLQPEIANSGHFPIQSISVYTDTATTTYSHTQHHMNSSFLGSPFWVRFFWMWPFLNPTIEVVTFHLRGWCMLGVLLLPASTGLGHECQDLLSLCDGMHVCTD